MKITVLGSGTSSGVPNVAFGWGDCDPRDPRNHRTRCSLYIDNGADKILIDTTPDLRHQLLREGIGAITAVLFTHDHADHCHGIDDLRPLVLKGGGPLPGFFSAGCFDLIQKKFDYIFPKQSGGNQFYPPLITPTIITHGKKFVVGQTPILPFAQTHGSGVSTGFRIGDFAYSTDVSALDEAAFAALEGVKYWVVDALQLKPHGSHSNLANTLAWIERVKPTKAFLTHLSIFMDHEKTIALCPPHVAPLYDGQVIEAPTP